MSTVPKQIIPLSKFAMSTACEGVPKSQAKPAPKPATPSARLPDMSSVLYSLDYGHPSFREPDAGEFILGIYRDNDGRCHATLLWADPKVDLFWDLALRQHVNPPAFYVRIEFQPQLDALTGHPVINGMVCPF
jgi:hypothetical protein